MPSQGLQHADLLSHVASDKRRPTCRDGKSSDQDEGPCHFLCERSCARSCDGSVTTGHQRGLGGCSAVAGTDKDTDKDTDFDRLGKTGYGDHGSRTGLGVSVGCVSM